MAILESNQLISTAFEPKLQNRFICYVDGIPTYMIKKVSRPKIKNNIVVIDHINTQRKVKGKTTWDNVNMELYDPISPSGAQVIMEWQRLHSEQITGRDGYSDFYKKDVTFNMIGGPGDIVEEWVLKGAMIESIDFGEGDWGSDAPTMINLVLAIDSAILQY